MKIYKITIKTNNSIIYDVINIGLIFIDEQDKSHLFVSMEKLKKIEPFISDKEIYKYIQNAIKFLKKNANEINKEFLEEVYLTYSPMYFSIIQVDWLSNFSDSKFENKNEIYEHLFKMFIYDNIRADKINNIINS
jgi:RecG-like helicase